MNSPFGDMGVDFLLRAFGCPNKSLEDLACIFQKGAFICEAKDI
ncbi:MAG: hypothetical protein PVH84_06825 [Candidatus Aminicenantes bacterium]|jgi:hypothetical protein